MSFEKWADDKFGSEFINEETITYFRMSAAFDAGADEVKQQLDELLAALKEARRWIGDGDMSDDATAIHHWSAGYAKAIADTDAVIAKCEA